MIPNKKMKVEEALELLDGWQQQLVHGKTYFRDIADVIRDLGVDIACQKVQLQSLKSERDLFRQLANDARMVLNAHAVGHATQRAIDTALNTPNADLSHAAPPAASTAATGTTGRRCAPRNG